MRELINDLLEYSRVESRKDPFTFVDMNRVLARTLELLKVPIEESGVEILSEPLPIVIADESQMVQVIQNLLGNAIKFRVRDHPIVWISAADAHQLDHLRPGQRDRSGHGLFGQDIPDVPEAAPEGPVSWLRG